MPELTLTSLDTSEEEEYWNVYTSARSDLLAPEPKGYVESYLALSPEAQREYLAYREEGRIVGTVRLGYDGLVEAPHSINSFSVAQAFRRKTADAILLAGKALVSRGADEVMASYDEDYAKAFKDVGFTERFSRMLMEAPLGERERAATPLDNPRAEDVGEIASFLMGVYDGHMEQQFGMHVGTPEDWLGYIWAVWKDCRAEASWVSRDHQGIAGLCLVGSHTGHPFIIEEGVRKDRRRQGLGRALLTRTMAVLREAGDESLWLEVTVGNDPALRLYESLGFKRARNRTVWASVRATDLPA